MARLWLLSDDFAEVAYNDPDQKARAAGVEQGPHDAAGFGLTKRDIDLLDLMAEETFTPEAGGLTIVQVTVLLFTEVKEGEVFGRWGFNYTTMIGEVARRMAILEAKDILKSFEGKSRVLGVPIPEDDFTLPGLTLEEGMEAFGLETLIGGWINLVEE